MQYPMKSAPQSPAAMALVLPTIMALPPPPRRSRRAARAELRRHLGASGHGERTPPRFRSRHQPAAAQGASRSACAEAGTHARAEGRGLSFGVCPPSAVRGRGSGKRDPGKELWDHRVQLLTQHHQAN